jgi:hypothetical protein
MIRPKGIRFRDVNERVSDREVPPERSECGGLASSVRFFDSGSEPSGHGVSRLRPVGPHSLAIASLAQFLKRNRCSQVCNRRYDAHHHLHSPRSETRQYQGNRRRHGPAPAPQPVSRVVITLPAGQQLAGLDSGPAVALSPDGTRLAYVAIQGCATASYQAVDLTR